MPYDDRAKTGTVCLAYDADALADEADAASRDVEDQLGAIGEAILAMGGRPERVGITLDLRDARARLERLNPGLVVNLVESLGGSDRMQSAAAMLFEDLRLPFTGSGALALALSNHKIHAKRRLAESGIDVPGAIWLSGAGEPVVAAASRRSGAERGDWIVKTLESHASLYLDDGMVLPGATAGEAAAKVRESEARYGQAFFAEQFIDGREFNISLLEENGSVRLLPPAEIRFVNWEPARPRIVCYAAKWDETSRLHAESVRCFDFFGDDVALLERLGEAARRTWAVLGLAGYARVDFRVDAFGVPYVLEANANPCLSPDAGFAAAAERGGMSYLDMMRRIVAASKK